MKLNSVNLVIALSAAGALATASTASLAQVVEPGPGYYRSLHDIYGGPPGNLYSYSGPNRAAQELEAY
jgi:hypothetical protein